MPVGLFLLAIDAGASPVIAPYEELPACDSHTITLTDELGNPAAPPLGVVPPFGGPGPFPADEAIASESFRQDLSRGCIADPLQAGPDFVVHILNMTPTYWKDLFFVADASNFFNNHDGMILGGLAMRIDMLGVNTPLISESMATDGIFEPGEEWFFAVIEWIAPLGPPSFASIGVGAGSAALSTASIVANPVPVPAAVWLLGSALGVLGWVRRKTIF